MTIAACYLSAEGVVFGADSTTTFSVVGPAANLLGPARHFNYAQKIFQVGSQDSTLGVTLWGMADLGDVSYRTLIAQFAEQNYQQPTLGFADLVQRFSQAFWQEYSTRRAQQIQRAQQLFAQPHRTLDEERELLGLLPDILRRFLPGWKPAP